MITRCLMTVPILAMLSVSAVQAADVAAPKNLTLIVPVPDFSWTGSYIGGQIGCFSGKTVLNYLDDDVPGGRWVELDKELTPKLSGFAGGFFAGSNIALGNGLVLGIDTDAVWFNKKDTKTLFTDWGEDGDENGDGQELSVGSGLNLGPYEELDTGPDSSADEDKGSHDQLMEVVHVERSARGQDKGGGKTVTTDYTLEQKWSGATRIRVGFVTGRIMPYIAGGVAYTQLHGIYSETVEKKDVNPQSYNLEDDKKTMVGYTLGGGLDYAVTDNIILRAEYRYSDFGKKKFAQDRIKIHYRADDFRVGMSYKF
ncbi:hemin binding protein [Bartonella australis AUST/NH1]|uniref:Porin n=1 Tax=Bartonella australis (strain Aust/NH1) TaxID=1094489 RepID=M1N2Y4_BARAA|nr:outer membrane protein [Bartonella australis]AGF74279.1 hemin binding protein [Bartonella australis AUST/NH1]